MFLKRRYVILPCAGKLSHVLSRLNVSRRRRGRRFQTGGECPAKAPCWTAKLSSAHCELPPKRQVARIPSGCGPYVELRPFKTIACVSVDSVPGASAYTPR